MKDGIEGWLSTAVMTGRTEVSERALGRGLEDPPGYSRKFSRACADAAGMEFNELVGNWNWFGPGELEVKA
jgi:hypothetical protein